MRQFPRGFGGMLAIEVAGGVEGGQRFCDALELAWVATSLGGTHTLVGHAASTTHRQMDPEARRAAGIADGLVRVSVGIEDADDIIDDFAPGAGEGVSGAAAHRRGCSAGGRPSTRSAASRRAR